MALRSIDARWVDLNLSNLLLIYNLPIHLQIIYVKYYYDYQIIIMVGPENE